MARPRRMTADRRWQVMEYSAWRRIGHDHAYMIAFGPYMARLAALLVVVAALTLLWIKVPHVYLGVGALGIAAVLGMGWFAWTGSNVALQKRMSARAAGNGRRGVGLGWAVSVVVALLVGTGWLALFSPYA